MAMQAAAAAHLQGWLTPKKRGGRYTLVMGIVIMATTLLHEEIKLQKINSQHSPWHSLSMSSIRDWDLMQREG